MTNKSAENRIQQIPEVQQAGLYRLIPIHHGITNSTYQAETGVGTWAIRLDHNTLPGVNRVVEAKLLQKVCQLGLAPAVVVHDLVAGYLVSHWVDEVVWTAEDFNNPQLLKRLAVKLQRLHQVVYNDPSTRLDCRIEHYLEAFDGISEDIEVAIRKTIDRLSLYGFWQQQNKLVHFDLNPGNIIGHDDPMIIDWEFAGSGHPLFDWLVIQYYAPQNIPLPSYVQLDCQEQKEVTRLIQLLMELWPSRLASRQTLQ